MYKKTLCALLALVWASALSPAAFGQAGCEAPALNSSAQAGENLFTPALESSLSDFLGDRVQGELRTSANPAMTRHLQEVGSRLVAQLPPTGIHFHFYLIDLAEPNAFSLPGGRIYVSQSLIAFLHSDDELAGVLAHEIGHIVTHQGAIRLSKLFRRVLSVTAIHSSSDFRQDLARLEDNWARDPGAFKRSRGASTKQEEVADQIALYAMARAGYSPQSFVDAFNRIAETHGKTGNWLNNLLGLTDVDTQRLRDQIQTLRQMPSSCIEKRPLNKTAFHQYQVAVSEFSNWDRKEILPGQLSAVKLDPPLQPDIGHVRFSPDGKYILAQNSAQIFVFTHQPFAFQFAIHAQEAEPAHFTPDSSSVVFNTRNLRVEKWSLASRKRESVFLPVVPGGCKTTVLSPDGKTLGCFRPSKDVLLLDVETGTTIFKKGGWKTLDVYWGVTESGSWYLSRIALPEMEFSPDGRYFVASNFSGSVAYDLEKKDKVKMPDSLLKGLQESYAFIGNDKVLGHKISSEVGWYGSEVSATVSDTAAVLTFPKGKTLSHFKIGAATFDHLSADGKALVYFGTNPAGYEQGILDCDAKKFLMLDKRLHGLDALRNQFVTEDADGSVGLFGLSPITGAGMVMPPGSLLSSPRFSAFSPDLKWLAVSMQDHGGLWNLQTGQRLYNLQGFRGAWFRTPSALYSDFPAWGKRDRALLGMGLTMHGITHTADIKEKHAWQTGRYLVVTIPKNNSSSDLDQDVTKEIRNVVTGKVLWNRHFPKDSPYLSLEPDEGALSLMWPASDGAVKDEAEKFPAVEEEIRSDKEKNNDYFAESFAISSGKPLGAALVSTGKGSFDVNDFFAEGGRLFAATDSGQVLVYSLADGKQTGSVFGSLPVVAPSGSLMAVQAEPSELEVYRLPSLSEAARFYFSSRVLWTRFSQDGKELAVLTADETVHLLDLSHPSAPAVAASNAKP